jgi:hypothetical protein
MRHGHQASADRLEPVADQQVESQGPQQSQHLNTVALGLAVSVLTELGVAGPLLLVFDCPALPHQPQHRFWAAAQGGDEQVDVVIRLAVTPAGALQLDNPAGTRPAFTDGICGIAGSELPIHLMAMAGLDIVDLHWDMPVAEELGDDLPILPAPVLFDRQEQVAALLAACSKTLARRAGHLPRSAPPRVPACSGEWIDGDPYTFEGYDTYADSVSSGTDRIVAQGNGPVDTGLLSFGPGSGIEVIENATVTDAGAGGSTPAPVRLLGNLQSNVLDFSIVSLVCAAFLIGICSGGGTAHLELQPC